MGGGVGLGNGDGEKLPLRHGVATELGGFYDRRCKTASCEIARAEDFFATYPDLVTALLDNSGGLGFDDAGDDSSGGLGFGETGARVLDRSGGEGFGVTGARVRAESGGFSFALFACDGDVLESGGALTGGKA